MKKFKNLIIFLVVFALIAGVLAVLSFDFKDDTNSSKDTTDTENSDPQVVQFTFCDCEGCQAIIHDFDIYRGHDSIAGDLCYTALYTGEEVTFCINSYVIYVSTTDLYDTKDAFSMGGLEYKNITLEPTYYIWGSYCSNAASAASVASYALMESETTTLAATFDAEPGEVSADDADWTPYY